MLTIYVFMHFRIKDILLHQIIIEITRKQVFDRDT